MKRLPDFIDNTGAGFLKGQPGRTANLVKRDGNVAMYLRDDGVYELGLVKDQKGGEAVIGGKNVVFEEKETYWNDDDFGKIAKTTLNKEHAFRLYKEYLEHSLNDSGEKTVPSESDVL